MKSIKHYSSIWNPQFKLLKNCFFRIVSYMFFIFPAVIHAQTFPAGFSQVKVASIIYPTSMAFAPDGRIFCTEKAGKVKIIKNGVLLSTPFLQVSVNQLNERGLSSIAIDPDFNNNHYVYIFYTTASSPIHNRLSRFTANGDVAVAGSEVEIYNFEACINSIHNGGGMVFGEDRKLFLALGNDNVNSYSQDLNNYKGNILRINTDFSVPTGNPFTGSEVAKRTWAYGFRNPWSITLQPGTNKLFANDVGEGTWEEINNITVGGKNCGWPGSEGMSTNPAYTNPVYAYHHGATGTDNGCAITGGAFFNPSTSNYPSQYTGKYFFIDYCNHWINYLDLSNGAQKFNFATNLANALNYIKVGTDGNLYYFSISTNSLYKIIYSNTNSPVITDPPDNLSVSQGQQAIFSVAASGTNPLSYQWKKNGNNISGAYSSTYTINNVQTSDAGQYSVYISNSFGNVTSNEVTLSVTAFNAKPVATIITPTSGTFYRDGNTINFSGNGTDQENGILPASAFNWVVEFHHDMHLHPGPYITPNIKNGSFVASFGAETAANVYFRLILYVTDSQGAMDTAFVDIHPVTSTLSLVSQPSGLQLQLEGLGHLTPHSVLAISGMTRTLGVGTPQVLNGINYVFDHWVHGGNATQNILITDNNQTYTAVFTATGSELCTASGTITRDYWANVTGSSVSNVPINTTPTSTSQLGVFEGPSQIGAYYGSRIRGYICPPTTGNYIFWIASDNDSELWLSTNDQPANKIKIAFVPGFTSSRNWIKYPQQKSGLINLTAGKKYYIEAIHREGTEGDNLAVGWQLPNGTLERPIPGTRLSPISISNSPVVAITSPTSNSSYPSPSNITINAAASSNGGNILKVEFYQGTTKIGEDMTSPYSFTWVNVMSGNYVLKAIATNNTNQTATSTIVNITVTACPTPIITALGSTTMCSGSVILQTNTGSGSIYQWKKDGVNISGATNSSFTATTSGAYQLKVIQGSCISWSAPTLVKILNGLRATITPGGVTTFCTGGNVKLFANTCSGYSYQWKKNGAYISGAINASYTATTSGNYQVQVTQGGVDAWSGLLAVTVNVCKELEIPVNEETEQEQIISNSSEQSDKFSMNIFPNPNTGLFTIVLNLSLITEENVKMKIVNILGQEVYNKEYEIKDNNFKEIVELDKSLPTGIYTLQVIIGDKIENTSM
ncbi:MAG: PQQ-dependent sugar dehydrogenase, partial [Bacteroidetes bacterium]|nr:PQQ-dependent sugar dehydrogenase [Bacteroidota bacterium]